MTKDRLKDLQKAGPWPRVTYRRLSKQLRASDLPNATNDVVVQFTTVELEKEHNTAEFLAQIDLIRLLIDKIEEDAKHICIIHKKMLEPMPNPKLAQELDDKTADIKKLSYDISTKLTKMEQIQKDYTTAEQASALWRIQQTQIFNITKRFREVMNAHNSEFVLHRDRCKREIDRELKITGIRKTDDELEEMLEKGSTGTFTSFIMVDIEKAKQAANAIEARHQDITKLENSIKELHSMFVDLNRLVAIQGEMIDNIEHNVSKAVDFVGDAAVQVKETVDHQHSMYKKKIIIGIILIAVVLIFLLIFGAYFTTQSKLLGR